MKTLRKFFRIIAQGATRVVSDWLEAEKENIRLKKLTATITFG
ncbi:MAG: hypothetical protein WC458_00135 [Patescibacteria group bacterium]